MREGFCRHVTKNMNGVQGGDQYTSRDIQGEPCCRTYLPNSNHLWHNLYWHSTRNAWDAPVQLGSKPTMDLLLGTPPAGLAGAATPTQPPLLSVEAHTHLHHPPQTLHPPTAHPWASSLALDVPILVDLNVMHEPQSNTQSRLQRHEFSIVCSRFACMANELCCHKFEAPMHLESQFIMDKPITIVLTQLQHMHTA